jgi:cbb3-type cytochrome oxidase subunit 3
MMQAAASTTAGMAGLLIFLGMFLFIVASLLRPGAKAEADRNARIPFKEDGFNG